MAEITIPVNSANSSESDANSQVGSRSPESQNPSQERKKEKKTEKKKKAKSKAAKDKTPAKQRYCLPSCKQNGKETSQMVQCHLCQVWYHYDCIGENESDIIGIWCCQKCRKLSESVSLLVENVASLEGTVKLLQENNTVLTELLNEQYKSVDCLKQENALLREQMASMRQQLKDDGEKCNLSGQIDRLLAELMQLKDNLTTKSHSSGISCEIQPFLLGDTLIHSVMKASTKDKRTVKVLAEQRASIKDIGSMIDKHLSSEDVQDVYVVCGTEETWGGSADRSNKNDLLGLIRKLGDLKGKKTVSSILPPQTNPAKLRCEQINAYLQSSCKKMGVTYMDHSNNFLFRDSSRDNTAFGNKPGTILSSVGVERLLSNFAMTPVSSESAETAGNSHVTQRNRRETTPRVRATPQGPSRPNYRNHSSHKTTKCWYCGETGHISEHCRHGDRIRCHKCNSYGHKQKHCLSTRSVY